MKKTAIIASYLFLGSMFIFSGCNDDKKALQFNECPTSALCVYKIFSYTQNIIPNAYKAQVRITESDTLRKGGEIEPAVKKDIANTLNDIIALSKASNFCEGGNYDLHPNIQYKDGAARDTVGYTLNFNLECDVPQKQKKDYDQLIANIDKKINKNKYLTFLAPNVSIIATPQAWQEAQDKAFDGALNLANDATKDYAKMLNKKCYLSSADALNNNVSIQPRALKATANMSVSADISWELPTPKEQEVQAKIQVKYICQ